MFIPLIPYTNDERVYDQMNHSVLFFQVYVLYMISLNVYSTNCYLRKCSWLLWNLAMYLTVRMRTWGLCSLAVFCVNIIFKSYDSLTLPHFNVMLASHSGTREWTVYLKDLLSPSIICVHNNTDYVVNKLSCLELDKSDFCGVYMTLTNIEYSLWENTNNYDLWAHSV